MRVPPNLADNEHLVEVDATSFGYIVTHKRGKKMLYTASYEKEIMATRTATGIARQCEESGETVWLCLNYVSGV